MCVGGLLGVAALARALSRRILGTHPPTGARVKRLHGDVDAESDTGL